MSFELPSIILTKTESADKYLLLSTFRVDNNRLWRFEIIENPLGLVLGGTWENDGPIVGDRPIEHLRESGGRRKPKVLSGKVWTTGHYMNVPGLGNLYEYVFSNPNTTLPELYFKVATGCDQEMKWHFQIGVAPVLVPPDWPEAPVLFQESEQGSGPVSQTNIPVHIFRAFVDMAIQKKEECPVNKEPLTRTNVAGTPCGHLFTNDAILSAIQYNAKCPTCRAPLTNAQIQRW